MAEYDSYTDTNGVRWAIYTSTASMIASVPDDDVVPRRYVPPAEDLVQLVTTTGDSTRAEVERVAFAKLRDQVEEYARAHTANVALVVATHPDKKMPWWLWVALGYVILKS